MEFLKPSTPVRFANSCSIVLILGALELYNRPLLDDANRGDDHEDANEDARNDAYEDGNEDGSGDGYEDGYRDGYAAESLYIALVEESIMQLDEQ
jgi:flagellar biosynthesis/type III secretory pathway protein FliH